MIQISTILLDDDESCTIDLRSRLEEYCPQVSILKICHDPRKAVVDIQQLRPDLLFLDIQMDYLDGFQLLEQYFPEPDFLVIFTTNFPKYTLRALQLSALDFLHKPIQAEELMAAVARAQQRLKRNERQNDAIREMLTQRSGKPLTVRLTDKDGFERKFDLNTVIRFDVHLGYPRIYWLQLGKVQEMLIGGTLVEIEAMLEGTDFFQVHRGNLVNLHHISAYHRVKGQIKMTDGQEMNISRRLKDRFDECWETFHQRLKS